MTFCEVLALEQVEYCYEKHVSSSYGLLEQRNNSSVLFKVQSICGFLLPGMVWAV